MTTPPKKKLIEVALPLEAINKASVREKSIRHGHPSTLHLWWARRPLATCRAVLFAQLVDDPASHPDKFPTEEAVEAERKRLFGIIEELVEFSHCTNETVLNQARAEIRKSCGGKLPPVYDPFSGGGSIPLEAQRLGLPAYGSDLNPVAVMIGKAMIEIPPKFKDWKPVHPGIKGLHENYRNAEGLAEDVKHYGQWMREKALERIGHLYPQVELPKEHGRGKATVIAWIWARTVPSPDPAFADVQVPIASTFLLCSKKDKEAWIEPIVDRQTKTISYHIRYGGTQEEIDNAKLGTSAGKRQAFRCIMSGTPVPYDHIRRAGKEGRMGQKLIAIVAEGQQKRVYIAPPYDHEQLALSAKPNWQPETALPDNTRDFKTPNYGLTTFGDLFTNRQLVALNTFSDLVHEARQQIEADGLVAGLSPDATPLRDGGTGAKAYAEAVSVYLGFAVDRLADRGSTLCRWDGTRVNISNTFARQALPMVWDFAEGNAFSSSTGNWRSCITWIWKVLGNLVQSSVRLDQHDAQTVIYPENTVISTDPPYYDNIGYADLSDFFFCWMRRTTKTVFPDLFNMLATPKAEELVATPFRHGGTEAAQEFFLDGMRQVMKNMVRQCSEEIPAAIYYAFKQNEIVQEGISSIGWATFLQAVIEAGYAIVGTWPMRTELSNRMNGLGSNALANSVVLVCRKRQDAADTITRAEFIRALKRELPSAIRNLQATNIAPTDMPQSAIGPGMAVFSRYKAVLEANDNPMTVKTALQLINAQLDEFLNELQGEFDPETRFAVTWFEQHGNNKGNYGIADNLARARGISVENVQQAGIVASAAGHVRILGRSELDRDWDPATDHQLTIWECCQHLIRVLAAAGESAAARLLKAMGSDKGAMVKDLAYYCYDVCTNKRQDAQEAMAYKSLIAVWAELTRQAAAVRDPDSIQQMAMDTMSR
ncbi:MAG: hypothetical protein TH68_11015 [Candidatus Synechococcus spongiarum 142]|uniref:DUF1156 domain-containing protein n=1 Tax=Candidatus Synechococcus spongiarum 142 TaxID=1608213 RepID=A0A6N3X0U2_9SYNE|nr:MAG: hypothetical protein TH68_11015 [Candidatus Synechococcus spongiarum 142]